jgi:vacuolar-type H+-ATPase catalytic subunit A/Vma1
MTADELKAELEAGKSIAQVAEERGVDVQVVVDALVAEGTERLEQAIEELPTRVEELVEREGLPEHPHGPRGPRGPGAGPAGEADDAAAEDAAA